MARHDENGRIEERIATLQEACEYGLADICSIIPRNKIQLVPSRGRGSGELAWRVSIARVRWPYCLSGGKRGSSPGTPPMHPVPRYWDWSRGARWAREREEHCQSSESLLSFFQRWSPEGNITLPEIA
ncbi:hypothetical protein J6590_031336 [Homalodisca vitripennis]|nr:hypothetical protein J6590_031336 [Homalodisca vitripennis]